MATLRGLGSRVIGRQRIDPSAWGGSFPCPDIEHATRLPDSPPHPPQPMTNPVPSRDLPEITPPPHPSPDPLPGLAPTGTEGLVGLLDGHGVRPRSPIGAVGDVPTLRSIGAVDAGLDVLPDDEGAVPGDPAFRGTRAAYPIPAPTPRPSRTAGRWVRKLLREDRRPPVGVVVRVDRRASPCACGRGARGAPRGWGDVRVWGGMCWFDRRCPEPDLNRYAREGQRGLSSPCLHSTIRAGHGLRAEVPSLSGRFPRTVEERTDVVLFY